MNTIIFATTNKHKIKEIQDKTKDWNVSIISMADEGINIDIEETGLTFEDNARLKAKIVSQCTDKFVLADDSGLEVDYINKEPGIYSSRYLGEEASYTDKMNDIIIRLENAKTKQERSARFVCAMSLYKNGEEICTLRGTLEGFIGEKIIGAEGFGYDPFFYIESNDIIGVKTDTSLGEICLEDKNKISHRANAIKNISEACKHLWI
ncbi:MAG: non-canonical purine NTP pyrophosphatase, RdgB/HAM1 family [Candidatus Epulonipiscioides saccharophilum]|nr:MAG: non-canonical purine NTP pyrophosphatase, RdgB/HAM1 family [Epulopiscium sp. AS2M-Bin001]